MKRTLMVFLASTALGAALGAPTFAALHQIGSSADSPQARVAAQDGKASLILASDDDHENRGKRAGRSRDDDDDDDDECDDDDGGCNGGAPNPAPAGTVAPPKNGLFGTGAPPQVRVN